MQQSRGLWAARTRDGSGALSSSLLSGEEAATPTAARAAATGPGPSSRSASSRRVSHSFTGRRRRQSGVASFRPFGAGAAAAPAQPGQALDPMEPCALAVEALAAAGAWEALAAAACADVERGLLSAGGGGVADADETQDADEAEEEGQEGALQRLAQVCGVLQELARSHDEQTDVAQACLDRAHRVTARALRSLLERVGAALHPPGPPPAAAPVVEGELSWGGQPGEGSEGAGRGGGRGRALAALAGVLRALGAAAVQQGVWGSSAAPGTAKALAAEGVWEAAAQALKHALLSPGGSDAGGGAARIAERRCVAALAAAESLSRSLSLAAQGSPEGSDLHEGLRRACQLLLQLVWLPCLLLPLPPPASAQHEQPDAARAGGDVAAGSALQGAGSAAAAAAIVLLPAHDPEALRVAFHAVGDAGAGCGEDALQALVEGLLARTSHALAHWQQVAAAAADGPQHGTAPGGPSSWPAAHQPQMTEAAQQLAAPLLGLWSLQRGGALDVVGDDVSDGVRRLLAAAAGPPAAPAPPAPPDELGRAGSAAAEASRTWAGGTGAAGPARGGLRGGWLGSWGLEAGRRQLRTIVSRNAREGAEEEEEEEESEEEREDGGGLRARALEGPWEAEEVEEEGQEGQWAAEVDVEALVQRCQGCLWAALPSISLPADGGVAAAAAAEGVAVAGCGAEGARSAAAEAQGLGGAGQVGLRRAAAAAACASLAAQFVWDVRGGPPQSVSFAAIGLARGSFMLATLGDSERLDGSLVRNGDATSIAAWVLARGAAAAQNALRAVAPAGAAVPACSGARTQQRAH